MNNLTEVLIFIGVMFVWTEIGKHVGYKIVKKGKYIWAPFSVGLTCFLLGPIAFIWYYYELARAQAAKYATDVTVDLFGEPGRQIEWTDSVLKNCNLCTALYGKFWHGDIDLKWDAHMLQTLANRLERKVYVLDAADARLMHERRPLLKQALAVIEPELDILKPTYND